MLILSPTFQATGLEALGHKGVRMLQNQHIVDYYQFAAECVQKSTNCPCGTKLLMYHACISQAQIEQEMQSESIIFQ